MYTKDQRRNDSTIGVNKLIALTNSLKAKYNLGILQTQEEIISEFRGILSEYYTKLSTPFLKPIQAIYKQSPSYEAWNTNFLEISRDLEIIFKELNNLQNVTMRNFNFAAVEGEKLKQYSKRILSKLEDYILYAHEPSSAVLYFKDSFNDLSKVEPGTNLISTQKCFVNLDEGIVTLPIAEGNAIERIQYTAIVNKNYSNGSAGNLQELNAKINDNLLSISDNNPDTTFEYEKVTVQKIENAEPLILDLTLKLVSPSIVNHIQIIPNNFGTQTPVYIKTIDTSLDGEVWTSIKDDIPIADYRAEDEENVFTLTNTVSKNKAQGIFTFTPRKVNFVHITLIQSTPYEIISAGSLPRWRYAIGLHSIELTRIKYNVTGELVSALYTSSQEINKLALYASENPANPSELADVKHQISIDDGGSWLDIQPQHRTGQEVEEILNFNNIEDDSISTADPIYSFRHRLILNRDSNKFKEGTASLAKTTKTAEHIGALSSVSPVKILLDKTPIPNSVYVMNPLWCARAIDGAHIANYKNNLRYPVTPSVRILGQSNGQPNQRFANPLSEEIGQGNIEIHTGIDNSTDYNEIVLWVDNDCTSWTRVRDVATLATVGSAKNYVIEPDGTIVFGNHNSSPDVNSNYSQLLTIDGDDDLTLVDSSAAVDRGNGAIPPTGSRIGITLKEETLVFTNNAPFQATFKFPTDGNKNNVHIYRRDAISELQTYNIPPKIRLIRLPHQHIVANSLTLSNTGTFMTGTPVASLSLLDAEGKYYLDDINGIIYLHTAAPATVSNASISYTYEPWYKLRSTDWSFVQSFDAPNQTIQILKNTYGYKNGSATPSEGDRAIDLGYQGIVPNSVVLLDTNFHSVVAPYQVKFIDGKTEFETIDSEYPLYGYYSVDYQKGTLYVSPDDHLSATIIYFYYTDFVACYNIVKYFDKTLFQVDAASKIVTIDSLQSLNLWLDRDSLIKQNNLLKIIYDYVETTRESIEELEPYFSPIVREYMIKTIEKE